MRPIVAIATLQVVASLYTTAPALTANADSTIFYPGSGQTVLDDRGIN